jgi:hypothetical protein
MGLAQIMPATARNPGFGLKPLSEEDIKDPVKNAAFGLQYFNAQKRYFNGDEEKAVAAYNAGAGNVNKAIKMAQERGGDWHDYLPAETKAYLPKVMAGRKPIEGAVADHIEQTTGERPTELQGAGMRMPGGGTVEQYQALNSKDPEQLTKLVYGLSTPPAIQRQALEQLHSDIKYRTTMDKIEAEFPSIASNPTAITRKMNDKEEGSYFKAYLFARLGLTELAQQEQRKISPDFKFSPVSLSNGENFSVKFNKDTNEVLGANDVQGRPVTDSKKLGQIAAQAMTASQVGHAGATRVRDTAGKEWSVVPTSMGSVFYDVNNVRGVPTGKTVPIQGGTDVELQNELQIQKNRNRLALLGKELQTRLEYIPAQEHNKAIAKFNAENGTNYGLMAGPNGTRQLVENAQPSAPSAPQIATGQAPAPQIATGQAPAPQAATGQAPAGQTPAQLKAEREISTAAGKSRAEQAGKNIDAELAKTQSIVDGAQQGLEAIKSGKHLLGGGANTAKYAYYDLNPLATRPEEFVNTQAILSLAAQDNISRLAQLIKPLSNTDLAYVQKYQLSRNSSPEEVNKWLYHYQEAAKVAYGRQVEAFQNPGKAPSSTVTPTTPNAASEQRIKKYNPATGRVE